MYRQLLRLLKRYCRKESEIRIHRFIVKKKKKELRDKGFTEYTCVFDYEIIYL